MTKKETVLSLLECLLWRHSYSIIIRAAGVEEKHMQLLFVSMIVPYHLVVAQSRFTICQRCLHCHFNVTYSYYFIINLLHKSI